MTIVWRGYGLWGNIYKLATRGYSFPGGGIEGHYHIIQPRVRTQIMEPR